MGKEYDKNLKIMIKVGSYNKYIKEQKKTQTVNCQKKAAFYLKRQFNGALSHKTFRYEVRKSEKSSV